MKEKFGGVMLTKLWYLTIKFDMYHKQPDYTMETENMINGLSNTGQKLTEEQKIQAVIHSLSSSRDQMKHHLSYSSDIQTFNDVMHYLELKEDCLSAFKINTATHVAYFAPQKGLTNKEMKKQRSFFFRNRGKDFKGK